MIFALSCIFACASTTKRLKDERPLGPHDPVQVFWSEPNLKFEVVCTIEAHGNNALVMAFQKKEDFRSIFEKEARKCGANGVIYLSMSPVTHGDVSAFGTGIKILSKSSALDADKIKTFSLAVRDQDLERAKELIKDIPKSRDERAPSDDELINIGLYLTALQGLKCDEKMVQLLQDEYQGRVTEYSMVKSFGDDEPDSNTPLCSNVMAKSLPEMNDTNKAVDYTQRYYNELQQPPFLKSYKAKIAAYHDLLLASAKLIQAGCAKSATDTTCALKPEYLKWAHAQEKSVTQAIRHNARDVLEILERQ